MPSYAWRCLACESECAAGDEKCHVCGCPAKSSVSQHETYRKAHLGISPPVREPRPEPIVRPEVAKALQSISNTTLVLIVTSVAVAFLGAWAVEWKWHLSSTRSGGMLLAAMCIGLTIAPLSWYLSRLKCPLCAQPWTGTTYVAAIDGWYPLWAFIRWRRCGSCGVSLSSRVEHRDT